MTKLTLPLILTLTLAANAQVQTPEMDKLLTTAAQSLTTMPFESAAPITIRGRVSTLVWPQGTSGMVIVEALAGGEKFAFSTARVPDMAKQGFTRFAVHPGEELIVTGVLAANKAKIGPGFTAARADLITKADGTRAFDRARLP